MVTPHVASASRKSLADVRTRKLPRIENPPALRTSRIYRQIKVR